MKRNSRGNMLVLSGLFITVNAVGLLVASSFGSLYFVHNRLQTSADELALVGARKLNEQDRLGQMNNMITRSRQLVHDARESDDDVQAHLNHLSELSDMLHNEARDGAVLLEQERQKLYAVSRSEAQAAVINRFNEIKDGHGLALPWLQAAVPVTPSISFGCTERVHSNVSELDGIDSLHASDVASNIIATDGSKLYKENIDAHLQGADTDLHFNLSSLPAPVQNSISPARAILAKNFKSVSGQQLCSTVQVKLTMGVDTGLGASAHSNMEVNGTAEATGGQPML